MLNLVFVHLGDAVADHLLPNIKRTQKLFPEHKVHLILSNQKLADQAAKIDIPVTFYAASEQQERILQAMEHDTEFRQGFWRFTVERLFALEIFHQEFPNEGLLHIESDVLILPAFPFNELENAKKLIWTKYNLTHDVSALLFSPNLEYSRWLVSEIESALKIDHSLTDMTVLSKIRKLYPSKVDSFPSVADALNKRLNAAYDSAALGMWLCGRDPRNHYGQLKLHLNDEFINGSIDFNPASFEYKYSPTLGLQVENHSQQIALYCLHIHSKDRQLFSETWESSLANFVNLSANKKEQTTFLFRVFIKLVFSNIKQRTFIAFIAGIPPIYRARMRLRQNR